MTRAAATLDAPAAPHDPWTGWRRDVAEATRDLLRGRRLVAVEVAHPSLEAQFAAWRELGAGPFLLLTPASDAPTIAPQPDVQVVPLPVAGETVSQVIAAFQRLMDCPPPDLTEALDAFDPTGDAVVRAPSHTAGQTGPEGTLTVWGRPALGVRTRRALLLEDKSLADDLWRTAGVPASEYALVPTTGVLPDVLAERLVHASQRWNAGAGSVWSADASRGMNGGTDLVLWVPAPHDVGETRHAARVARASRILAANSNVVRLQPYLEGVPCSVHGFVLPDGVAVFRPMELLVIRRPHGHPDRGTFQFCGVSTQWSPSSLDATSLRSAARRVGQHLAEEGYRGAFCIDGILAREGFFPTELNPRFSAGLKAIARGCPDLPVEEMHELAQAGRWPWDGWNHAGSAPSGPTAADLERAVLTSLHAQPVATVRVAFPAEHGRRPSGTSWRVDGSERGLTLVGEGQGIGTVHLTGPTAQHQYVAHLRLDAPQAGPRAVGWALGLQAIAAEVLGLDDGPWEPAGK